MSEVGDDVAPAERYAAWSALSLAASTTVDLVGGRARDGFDGRVRRLTASGIGSFADISAPRLRVRRAYGLPPTGAGADLQLTLVLDGGIVAGGGAVVEPGTLRLVDLAPPFESQWWGRHLRLTLPRALLESALGGNPVTLHGRVLPPQRLTPLLADHLRALAGMAVQFDETACAVALRMTTELAVTALQLEFGDLVRRPGEGGEAAGDALFAAACRIIELHLATPGLSPREVAARLGCSRSTLYRVFAKRELSIADHIRERRLQRCRAAIEASAGSPDAIADLAFGLGFENAVHFSRLFKARFGASPSEHRRRIAAQRADDAGPSEPDA